jgi:hypothetical protein
MAIAAVVSGSSRVVEIVEWAADLPDVAWDRLGATRDAFTGVRRVPDDSTVSAHVIPPRGRGPLT